MKYLKVVAFGLVFLLISAAVFVGVSIPPKTVPLENHGTTFVLPPSLEDKVFSLDGNWGFRHGGFYTVEEMAGADVVALPAPWEDAGYPAYGSGSYAITISSPTEQTLMLYLPEIISAYELYLNDELVSRSGSLSTVEGEMVENLNNQLLSVPLTQGENSLLFWVSNEKINGSGLFYSLLLGEEDPLLSYFIGQRAKSSIVLGAFLLIGLYFLILFVFRPKQKEYLVLGLICFTVFLRFLGDSNNLIRYFQSFPLGNVYIKVACLLYAFNVFLLCCFTNIAFSLPKNKVVRWVEIVSIVVPAAAIIMLKNSADVVVWMVPLIVPIVMGMVRAARSREIRQQPFLVLYLFSLVLYITFGGIAKLVADEQLFAGGLTASVFMLLVQCTLLADRYSYAMHRMETENQRLEHTVKARTAEVQEANAQLLRSQQALREMLQGISHDLKTPITILSQYLELLKLEDIPKSLEEQKQYVQIAYRKNLDIQRLISRLFEVARMEMRETPLKPEWRSLAQINQEFRASYAMVLEEKQITLAIDSPSEAEVEIFSDYSRLHSIVDNLVYNAMRHTPAGGSITLKATPTSEGMLMSVSDTGSGIAPEHLPYIFDRFYKVSKSREEKEGDSGLGLYMVKTLLEQMGSSPAVESTVGSGTSFSFLLPFRETTAEN